MNEGTCSLNPLGETICSCQANDTGVWTGDYCDVFEENSSLQSIFGLLFAVVIALLAIFITCVILLNKRGQKQLHEKGLGFWLKSFSDIQSLWANFWSSDVIWSIIGPNRPYVHPEKDKAAYIQRQIRDNPSRPSNFQGRNQQEEQYSGQELTDTNAVQLFIVTVCGFLIQAITQIWFQDRYHPRYFFILKLFFESNPIEIRI